MAASPFDAENWVAGREAYQHDVLRTIEPLANGRADHTRALQALRSLARRLVDGSGADAAAYSQRLAKYHCAFGARIHDLTNLRQREHARDKVRGWEEDLRELSADRRTAQAAAPGQPLPGSMR